MSLEQNHLKIMFLLLLLILPIASSASDYLIAFGITKSTTVSDANQRVWQSDDNSTFAPPNLESISTAVSNGDGQGPYTGARLFSAPVSYSFPITSGAKLIRFYYTTSTTYNNTPASQFFTSVKANGLTLLQNFSASLSAQNDPNLPSNTFSEFYLYVQKGSNLNLNFSSGCSSCFGFINAIEIITVPNDLYFSLNRTVFSVILDALTYYDPINTAFQTAYRINVGGNAVDPVSDSSGLFRTWLADQLYIASAYEGATYQSSFGQGKSVVKYTEKVPSYVAPILVYATSRRMQLNHRQALTTNLTWKYEVDPGFDYLVRLHFCDLDRELNQTGQWEFTVYINNQTADKEVDVWALTNGLGFPAYKDYVISLDGVSNGTKVPLWLALHPNDYTLLTDVLLNGLEIFKLNPPNGNLAVPNPPSMNGATTRQHKTPSKKSSSRKLISIIIGTIGGALIISLILVGCLVRYKRNASDKTFTSKTTSKAQWTHPFKESNSKGTTNGTNPSSIGSSLPSDLCRRFSLTQIRVATSDFNEDLVIGNGGFGKVYKGSIDNGSVDVAIKRLNSSSKQGFNEFRTEIEMLTRLRHLHLVSLIGYCEDHGEMILVYEYMSHGTLRDHLRYKDNNQNCTIEPLSWKQRLSICLGSARGLHYLHSGAKETIIHRDVKSTNILLDDKWIAKVSDFGLSKVGPASEAGIRHVSTAVKGSIGYLDPEYYRRQQLTEKSDVYSFGVVLFEVLCARNAVNPNLPREQMNLAYWARHCYKNDTLHKIIDPCLSGQIAPECLRKFGEIAEMCVRDHGDERPSMGDVVWSLDFALQLQQTAEKNNVKDGVLGRSFGDTENIGNGGDCGVTDNDMFTNTSVENLSGTQMGSKYDSGTGTGTSTSTELKSDSVFSEIRNPLDR